MNRAILTRLSATRPAIGRAPNGTFKTSRRMPAAYVPDTPDLVDVLLLRPSLDGRTKWAKRYRGVVAALVQVITELRGPLDWHDRLLVQHCAFLQVRWEQLQSDISHGDSLVDASDQSVRLSNSVMRLLDRLGLGHDMLPGPESDIVTTLGRSLNFKLAP